MGIALSIAPQGPPYAVKCIQHERFNTRPDKYNLTDVSLSLTGDIAVCGCNKTTGQVFIDLYLGRHSHRDSISDSRDKFKLCYSDDLEAYSKEKDLCISFLDNTSQIILCMNSEIKIIDTKDKSKVVRCCEVDGQIMCVAVREGEIFIGLRKSPTVVVFDSNLKVTKEITLKDIKDFSFPFDLQVTNDTILVCIFDGDSTYNAFAITERDGSIVSEYTYTPITEEGFPHGIAASKRLGLVAILWNLTQIAIYSLNESKLYLVLHLDYCATCIRISDRDRMIITGQEDTGEVKMHDLGQLFSYQALKSTMAYIVSPNECEQLTMYFGVTEEEMERKEKAAKERLENYGLNLSRCELNEEQKRINWCHCLLTAIEEKGYLDPYNINNLKDAVAAICDDMRVSQVQAPMEGYAIHGTLNLKLKYDELAAETKTREKAWEDEHNELSFQLTAARVKINECETKLQILKNQYEEQEQTWTSLLEHTQRSLDSTKKESSQTIELLTEQVHQTEQQLNTSIKEKLTFHRELEIAKELLEQTKQDRDVTKSELKRHQLEFAKESKALKEVLNQTKEVMSEMQKVSMVDEHLVDLEATANGDFSAAAAEFGRFSVAVAEYLTLDHCVKLATLLNVPPSDCDIVRRISFIESPGVKLLDVLKKRNVINTFDITNLQKGLAMSRLDAANKNVVVPYQEKIDKALYEANKVKEMFSWDAVSTFLNSVKDDAARHQMGETNTQSKDDSESRHKSQDETKAKAPKLEAKMEDKCILARDKDYQLYTECCIGREGGVIQVANASLTIPPDALHENRIIALTIMNESPFPLDGEVDAARMTPLIKLEPLGLKFKKSLHLDIPHSTLISEREDHDVIIYSGRNSKNNGDSSDSMTWIEEISIPRQLKKESVRVDIQCLAYFSASLVRQTTAPLLFTVRAVPFVDCLRNDDDDIKITICFCYDNDSEHDMLMSQYNTKLSLEQYTSLQLHRHSGSDEDDAGFLSVTVTSVNDTYVLDPEHVLKRLAISHLCTASRVSYQLRLKRNQSADKDVVDIVLTFSQAHYKQTKLFLKTRIKDLIMSEESERLLSGSLPSDNKAYKEMVVSISSSLGPEQCRKLAAHLQLTSNETEVITSSQNPGVSLMKTLTDRSVVDSQKMILFFEGLKACHLDERAELVSEYITEMSRQKQRQEEDEKIKDIEEGTIIAAQRLIKKGQKTTTSPLHDQSVQTTLSSSCVSSDIHVKTLAKEGYPEQEVVEALDISKNRVFMARKVLQFLSEQFDAQPRKDIFLYKEQYIDENGGDIILREANVYMVIPAGALSEGSIVSLTMMTSTQANVRSEGRSPQLTPVIKCGPGTLALNKPVTVRVPHCASETDGITSTDMLLGFSVDGETETHWRKRKQHEPAPVLKKDHIEVFLTQFCAIGLNNVVDYKKPLAKRLRALPVINRVTSPTDDLTVTLWIYNDDETEHMHLIHTELIVGGKIQLHDHQTFTIKGLGGDKEVHIKSENSRISPNTTMKKIQSSVMWNTTRHKCEFHFQNKEGVDDISFKIRLCGRKQLIRTVEELQLDVQISLDELLQKNEDIPRALIQEQQPQAGMKKSFEELVSKLSGQLSMESCLEIAGMYGLPADFRTRMKKSRNPGEVLCDELIQEQLITAASVSALDSALTKSGNLHLAKQVKKYRMRYTTFPTTIFTLL